MVHRSPQRWLRVLCRRAAVPCRWWRSTARMPAVGSPVCCPILCLGPGRRGRRLCCHAATAAGWRRRHQRRRPGVRCLPGAAPRLRCARPRRIHGCRRRRPARGELRAPGAGAAGVRAAADAGRHADTGGIGHGQRRAAGARCPAAGGPRTSPCPDAAAVSVTAAVPHGSPPRWRRWRRWRCRRRPGVRRRGGE